MRTSQLCGYRFAARAHVYVADVFRYRNLCGDGASQKSRTICRSRWPEESFACTETDPYSHVNSLWGPTHLCWRKSLHTTRCQLPNRKLFPSTLSSIYLSGKTKTIESFWHWKYVEQIAWTHWFNTVLVSKIQCNTFVAHHNDPICPVILIKPLNSIKPKPTV